MPGGLGTDEETQIHSLLLHHVYRGQWQPGKEQAQGRGGALNPLAVASSKPYMLQRITEGRGEHESSFNSETIKLS